MVEIRSNLVRNSFLCDGHFEKLSLFVAFIHREFVVRFDQVSCLVANLLPKADSVFFSIHLFEVSRHPSEPALNI